MDMITAHPEVTDTGSKRKRKRREYMDMITAHVPEVTDTGSLWDEKGRDQIAGIYVFYGPTRVNSLQFLFYENGKIVKSKIHGQAIGTFAAVIFDYPSEFLTFLSGSHQIDYEDMIFSRRSYLVQTAIKFDTNKNSYGPFGKIYDFYYFKFPVEKKLFGGFHGTIKNGSASPIRSIGVYAKLPIPLKDIQIKEEKEED